MENKNTKIDDSIEAFYAKCAKLNVPSSVMPEHQFLKRIFRGYMSPFESFNNRVDTKQDIERVRNAILVHKMKGIKKDTIKNSNPASLPEQLRLYLEYQKNCERIKACRTKSIKSKEQQVLERIKNLNVQKEVAEKELKLKRSRADILQALSNKLSEDLKTEEDVSAKIDSNQQILNVPNVIEEATKRVNQAVNCLKDFSMKGIFSNVAKENCMKEVEEYIYNVPNPLLFDILTNMLNSKVEDSIFDADESSKNSTEEMLDKFRELKIKLGFQFIASKKNIDDLKQTCATKIQQVENQLELLLDNTSMYYDDDDDDIVGEFVSVLFAKLIQEGKMKLVDEKIKVLKEKPDTKFFENLVQNINDSNQLIHEKVQGIQLSIAQAHLITEKCKFANMKLMRTVNNLKLEKHQQTNRTMLNQTICGFDKNVESGLLNTELELFLAMPLKGAEKIDLKLEHLFASSPITRLFPHNMPLFVKSLKALYETCQSAQMCAMEVPHSQVNILTSQFLESLEKKRDQNRTEIKEIFDSITKMNVDITSLFNNIQSIIKFIQENSLKKFIDQTQKYENKTYFDYEKEYLLYYKMIKQ